MMMLMMLLQLSRVQEKAVASVHQYCCFTGTAANNNTAGHRW
jgi:hypothetical protein